MSEVKEEISETQVVVKAWENEIKQIQPVKIRFGEPNIALLMMLKNEQDRILVTLKSIVGTCSCMIIYDTGSTDDTIPILKAFSERTGIPLHLKEGEFVNFATSRNVSLDYADTIEGVEYLLLMDCNDELQGGEVLLKEARRYLNAPETCFMMTQEWYSGSITTYENSRFIKPRGGWRYKGRVHEYLTRPENGDVKAHIDSKVVLYQDRRFGSESSAKRFARDKILLLEDHTENPNEPRTLFYLAQTCACLGQHQDAYDYYLKRSGMMHGFWEERFQAFMQCSIISKEYLKNEDQCILNALKAFEVAKRAEPLTILGEYYKDRKEFELAFMFLFMACSLQFPHGHSLFVNKDCYSHTRWHLLGIVAYYVGKYEEGEAACRKAIEAGKNKDLDTSNLKFYTDKKEELRKEQLQSKQKMTRFQFLQSIAEDMKKQNPKATPKQMTQKAKLEWKKYIQEFK